MAPLGPRHHHSGPRPPGARTLLFGILTGLVIGLSIALLKSSHDGQLRQQELDAAAATVGAEQAAQLVELRAQLDRLQADQKVAAGQQVHMADQLANFQKLTAEAATEAAKEAIGQQPAGGGGGEGGWRRRPQVPADLPREVYARGPSQDKETTAKVEALLSEAERKELRHLCGRTLYHSLQTGWVSHETGMWTFVATGDLPLMWIRDSAVQISVLLPRMERRPALRRVIEGAIRAQAFYILQDPYANGYEPEWRHPDERHGGDRVLGRGGWVGVRNYELDSGAYYLNLLWNWYLTPGLYRPEQLLDDPLILGAANLLVDVWIREQRHNATSPYRFVELSDDGLGPAVNYTGMTWSGFRPSDDPSTFGFPIAANMYAAAGLERALVLNKQVWRDEKFDAKASQLLKEIKSGIETHGRVKFENGDTVYAYEVDGKGSSLTDFDDPNIPSLVSIPILGYRGFDPAVYQTTRRRLLDPQTNKYYFKGSQFKGMGSPHTSPQMAWALGIYTEVLTATSPEEQAEGLRTLLKLQCGDGLMHESVHVNDLQQCTRKWFEWANALLVVSVEQLLGYDCDQAAQAFHYGFVKAREGDAKGPAAQDPRLYQTPESAMQWDGVYKSKVADWKGIGHLVEADGQERTASITPVEGLW